MKIAIIGTGYVGLVSGVCLSDFGHTVVCVDKSEAKIAQLNSGEVPIYEPGLDVLLAKNAAAGRLSFTTSLSDAVDGAEAVFIAVGTPSRRGDGHADLSYVFAAAEEVAKALTGYAVVVTKSTVPVGTNRKVGDIIRMARPEAEFDVASIREIMIITTPHDQEQFIRTLGDGGQWGISLQYKVQPSPDGLAQAFILAEEFLAGSPAAMVLGDNIFFGHGLPNLLQEADKATAGATVFGYRVSDPERYGVVDLDANGTVKSIIEKPPAPPSNYAVTGLYFVDGSAPERAREVRPSARGELEITALLESYLHDGVLNVQKMGRGYAWLDTGTHASLLDAGNFVRTLTERQGQQVGSPDEVAFEMGWINRSQLVARAELFAKTTYGAYLAGLVR